MMAGVSRSSARGARGPGRSLLLTAVCLAGAADVAELMVTQPSLMAGSPSRAGGSALGLLLFLALAATGMVRAGAVLRPLRRGTVAVLALGSLLLVAVHAAAHVGGLRPASVALLALLALPLAW